MVPEVYRTVTFGGMNRYTIKKATDLLPAEIETMLTAWSIAEWNDLSPQEFQHLFHASEFHLLVDGTGYMLSFARINFDFTLKINEDVYELPELVGFVSVQRGKGYGSTLLNNIITNLASRNVEALGFCESTVRPFYEKCGIPILYDQAPFICEHVNGKWVPETDDDILNLTLSASTANVLKNLTAACPAYLVS